MVKGSLRRRGIFAAAALGTAAGTLLATVPVPVQASPTDVLAAVGSDTTEDIMDTITASRANTFNVQARYEPGDDITVPGDAHCGTRTYTSGAVPPGQFLAPNGSSAGLNAMRDILNDADPTNNGCVDIARSSSSPRAVGPTGDRATFEYYAFGLDAVSWSSASLNAPATLTRTQVRDIYNCTFTDWSQVGGAPGAIQRYLPQPGSGTEAFFRGQFLGFDPRTISDPDGPDNIPGTMDDCPAVIDTRRDAADNPIGPLQENVGTDIDPQRFQKAIFPYSAGQWVFQANNAINPTLDKRNGFRIGGQVAVGTFSATTTNASTTINSTDRRFNAVNLGATITGPGIAAGTTITAVAADGLSATMSAPAGTGAGTGSVTMTSLSGSTARWVTIAPGGWIPNTPVAATNPRGPVAEVNVSVNNPNRDFVGVRYVFNVIDSGSPSYTEARGLVGFDNIPAGVKSPLCDAGFVSDILANGFAPLPTVTPAGVDPLRNQAASTCRRFTP